MRTLTHWTVDLTMKRPHDVGTRPTTPMPSSRSQIDVETEPLQEMHAPYSLGSSQQQQEGAGEVNLLADSNHAHFLLDSFYSSDLYQTIENRIGRTTANASDYSVWVDAPGQKDSAFSIPQFYHELVIADFAVKVYLYANKDAFPDTIIIAHIHQSIPKSVPLLCPFCILDSFSYIVG